MKGPIEAVIEDVIIQPSKIQPIIVNFQNGELKDEEAKKMSCGVFYDPEKQKTLLALSNGEFVYKGYRPDVTKELTHTMLVLHNRRTGKVRLVQAERWEVSPVLCKPRVLEDVGTEMQEKLAVLNKQFGSKKIKRRTEEYERMKINVDFLKERLEKTVSNVEVERQELSTVTKEECTGENIDIPQCNRDAKHVKDVYNMYDIVAKEKLETLYKTATEVLNNDAKERSEFFKSMLNHLRTDPDKIEKIAVLLYIEAVGTWFQMPMKDAKRKTVVVCPHSTQINAHIRNNYSVASPHGRLRPASMKDKGVIHCIILALAISNFQLDLELFSTIINARVGLKKMVQLARIVGAVTDKSSKNVILLKLPLPREVALIRKGRK